MFKRTINDLGTEWELATEFEEYKAIHKYSILFKKLFMYYETILDNNDDDGLQIPYFMNTTAEELAQRDIRELYNRDKNEFNRLYELAWEEMKEITN